MEWGQNPIQFFFLGGGNGDDDFLKIALPNILLCHCFASMSGIGGPSILGLICICSAIALPLLC